MTTETNLTPSVTVDGTTHILADLTPHVQAMIALHQQWIAERAKAQSDYSKADLAIKAIALEIGKQIGITERATTTLLEDSREDAPAVEDILNEKLDEKLDEKPARPAKRTK